MADPTSIGDELDAALAALDHRLTELGARVAVLEQAANPTVPIVVPTTRPPADILGLNGAGAALGGWWNLGIGYRPSDPERGSHLDTTPAQLAAGWTHPLYFRPTLDGQGVAFRVYCDGGRTSKNTLYPRAELREFTAGGAARATWSATKGAHLMAGCHRITSLPGPKPEVAIAQIHDGGDDTFQLRVEGLRWAATVRGKEVVDGDLQGDTIAWHIEVSAGRIVVVVDGQQRHTGPFTGTGHYFKTGVYAQSSVLKGGAKPDDYFEAELHDLRVAHS